MSLKPAQFGQAGRGRRVRRGQRADQLSVILRRGPRRDRAGGEAVVSADQRHPQTLPGRHARLGPLRRVSPPLNALLKGLKGDCLAERWPSWWMQTRQPPIIQPPLEHKGRNTGCFWVWHRNPVPPSARMDGGGKGLFWEIGDNNWMPWTLPFLQRCSCSRCTPVIYNPLGLKGDSAAALRSWWIVGSPRRNWMNRHGSSFLHSIVFIQRYT